MHGPIAYGFIDNDITVPDLDIVEAVRIGTNPGFVLDRGTLAAKVRKGNEIALMTFATLRKREIHALCPPAQAPFCGP
jgi:hypothetical protein